MKYPPQALIPTIRAWTAAQYRGAAGQRRPALRLFVPRAQEDPHDGGVPARGPGAARGLPRTAQAGGPGALCPTKTGRCCSRTSGRLGEAAGAGAISRRRTISPPGSDRGGAGLAPPTAAAAGRACGRRGGRGGGVRGRVSSVLGAPRAARVAGRDRHDGRNSRGRCRASRRRKRRTAAVAPGVGGGPPQVEALAFAARSAHSNRGARALPDALQGDGARGRHGQPVPCPRPEPAGLGPPRGRRLGEPARRGSRPARSARCGASSATPTTRSRPASVFRRW